MNLGKIFFRLGFVLAFVFISLTSIYQYNEFRKLQENTPTNVVRKYVSYSLDNNLNEIDKITAKSPITIKYENEFIAKHFKNEVENNLPKQLPKISSKFENSRVNTVSDVVNDFNKKSFPQNIFNAKLKVDLIEREIVKENRAFVSVLMGNDINFHGMPWTFVLEKNNEEWKIIHISGKEEAEKILLKESCNFEIEKKCIFF
jgi:hypothetical protein